MELFEAMETCRAIRYLKPDPIPQELLDRVLYGATRASNPGNSQGWAFVVVRDAEKRKQIQSAVAMGVGAATAEASEAAAAAPQGIDPMEQRIMQGATHLLEHLHLAPVIIFVCARACYPPGNPMVEFLPSTMLPAAQNLILAARGVGLGSVFTTFNLQAEAALREILELPPDVHMGAMIPLGYPERNFGPVKRRPVAEVVHYDGWDATR